MGLQANPSSKRSIDGLESSTSSSSRSAKQQCTIRVGSEAPDHLTASTDASTVAAAAWYNSTAATTATATTTTITTNYQSSAASAPSYVNGAYYTGGGGGGGGDVATPLPAPSEFTPHSNGKLFH